MANDEQAARLNELRGINPPPAPVKTAENDDLEKEKVIRKGLEKARPNYTRDEKEATVAKLMTKPAGSLMKDGGNDIMIEDFAFELADSIQRIESGTDPQEEYLEWMEKGPEIISEMNRSDADEEDLKERNDFLADLDQREMEIKSCISLYRMSTSEKAKKRLEFLMVKWGRLMELRSAVKSSTPDKIKTEKEKEREAAFQRRAVGYITALAVVDEAARSENLYHLRIDEAQDLIAAMTTGGLSPEKLKWRQNFLLSLSERERELLMRRDYIYKLGLAGSRSELEAIQRELAATIEMEKIVRLATRDPQQAVNNMATTEEDRERGEIYSAVLEYRRRGKEIPERVLSKLGIRSFVPEYSVAQEFVDQRHGTEPQSRDDVIKRINQLRGRQSPSVNATYDVRSRVNTPQAWRVANYAGYVRKQHEINS